MPRLTPTLAAPKLGMTAAALMAWIRTEKCPFGIYLKQEGNSRGGYTIFEKRMEAYIKGEGLSGS